MKIFDLNDDHFDDCNPETIIYKYKQRKASKKNKIGEELLPIA